MNLKTLIKNDKFMPEKYLQIWLQCFQSIISIINFDSYGVPFLTPMSRTNINLTYERSKFNFFFGFNGYCVIEMKIFFFKVHILLLHNYLFKERHMLLQLNKLKGVHQK